MKITNFISLTWFGIKTILFEMKKPVLGTIILTDYCNLSCKHCSVNNINRKMYSYQSIRKEMESFYRQGIRILFFCGGETLLWKDEGKDVRDLIKEASNFHTPYKGTEHLSLTIGQKKETVESIKRMIRGDVPVFNLYSALDAYLNNTWDRPCYQCIVSEDNKRYICGRCIETDGLCRECGYLFAVEFSLLFNGNIRIIYEMLKTYLHYV